MSEVAIHPIAERRRRRNTARRMGGAWVLICDPIAAEAIEQMRAGGIRVDECVGLSPEKIEAVIGDYDAVVVRSATRLGERQIAAARRLRLIVRGGVGTDNVDLAAAASAGIPVFNTPNASTASVAELALGLLLALARRIPQADAALKSGRWPKQELSDGIELEGRRSASSVWVGSAEPSGAAPRLSAWSSSVPTRNPSLWAASRASRCFPSRSS